MWGKKFPQTQKSFLRSWFNYHFDVLSWSLKTQAAAAAPGSQGPPCRPRLGQPSHDFIREQSRAPRPHNLCCTKHRLLVPLYNSFDLMTYSKIREILCASSVFEPYETTISPSRNGLIWQPYWQFQPVLPTKSGHVYATWNLKSLQWVQAPVFNGTFKLRDRDRKNISII